MHGRHQPLQGRRLGILTFHRCINYGSYWQARCLVAGLRTMGAEAVLLDHQSAAITSAEIRCAFHPTLPQPTPRSDFAAYGRKTRKFLEAFSHLPLSPAFPLGQPEEMEEYDAIIVGSDEVWNLCHPWYGGCPTFYGNGLRGRVVSYAASFGNQDAADGLPAYWADQLRGFAALSVRDENSRAMVRSALGVDPALVLDPCLQFPPHFDGGESEGEGRLVVYGHNFPSWFCDHVREWARKGGRRIVSIGYRNDWADEQRLSGGPHEFAHLMASADAVVTCFFHGCVFAILNQRPFLTAPSPYRANKVRDLMHRLGLKHRLATPEADSKVYASLLDEPLDGGVGERLSHLRQGSADYLFSALVP